MGGLVLMGCGGRGVTSCFRRRKANRTGGQLIGPLRFSIEHDRWVSLVADDKLMEPGHLPGCVNQFDHFFLARRNVRYSAALTGFQNT